MFRPSLQQAFKSVCNITLCFPVGIQEYVLPFAIRLGVNHFVVDEELESLSPVPDDVRLEVALGTLECPQRDVGVALLPGVQLESVVHVQSVPLYRTNFADNAGRLKHGDVRFHPRQVILARQNLEQTLKNIYIHR